MADGAELIGTTLTLGGGSGDIGILEGGAATVRQTKWGGAIKLGTVSGTKGVFVLRGTAIRQAEAGDLLLGTSSSITGYGSVNSSFTASFASVLDNSGTITASRTFAIRGLWKLFSFQRDGFLARFCTFLSITRTITTFLHSSFSKKGLATDLPHLLASN